ncbi:MAG: hypothetical protein GY699_14095 [Desulfobacteraceae bacterium]|nr:hypothetical protein [Desulfobacteraceae bacterium]
MDFDSFVKEEWENAYKEDFALFKRIPSSSVLSMIALYEKNKDFFTLEMIIKLALDRFSLPKEILEKIFLMESNEGTQSYSYLPVNQIKAIIENRISECEDHEERELLKKAQSVYKDISTPKAAETRKAFFPKLKKVFGVKPVNEGGGVWTISTPVNDHPMKLALDFGGRFSTFRYWIDVFPDNKPTKIVFLTYEKIMGFSDLDWNLMRTDLLDVHSDILIEVAQKTIKAISKELK